MELGVLLLLGFTAFIAGVIDTIAGGGGLITFPALLFSGLNPLQALGTGKLQSTICGVASVIYFKRGGHINYEPIYRYIIYICVGALIGAISIQFIHTEYLKKLIPFMLLGVLIYFLLPINKNQKPYCKKNLRKISFVGPLIGFYDGFFGPGTGSVWTVVLTRFICIEIKQAIMYAKLLNLVSSLTAFVVFSLTGRIHFIAAVFMGIGAYIGGVIGSRFVIYKDSTIVRSIFVILVSAAILGTFYKYYF